MTGSVPFPRAAWRLLRSPFADGPLNMAVDEAILQSLADGHGTPTLRFFGWQPPCLSLGYAQAAAEVAADRLAAHGYDLVRRPTGGRAILHTDELTYSVIAPMNEPRVMGGVLESYQQLSAGLLAGLQRLGLGVRADKKYDGSEALAKGPVCFEVPSNYEITVANGATPRKLLGSAQVRKRGVVLQHGTLPLTGDLGRICDVLVFSSDEARQAARARLQERAATVAEVLGEAVTWARAAEALADGFASVLNLELVEAPLSEREDALAHQLRDEKYATAAWNYRL
jgi:lipoyl(octanoyl) transferase